MLSAIMASTGGPGKCTSPSVAKLSVIECATVKAVIVQNSIRRPRTIRIKSKHEQEMVESEKDVLDSMQDVGARYREQSRRGSDLYPRAVWTHQSGRDGAVAHLYPHQHVGDCQLQAREFDALSRQPARPRVDPATFDERVREFAHDGVLEVLHTAWKLEDNGQPHAREHRRAPQDAELSRRCLIDSEIRWARLVRRRHKRHEKQGEQLADKQPPDAVLPGLHEGSFRDETGICSLFDVSPLADALSVGAGKSTVYFARKS